MKRSPSIRTKVIFFSLVCLLLLGFFLTLATLYAVQQSKERILTNARSLVRETADRLSQRIANLMDDARTSDVASLPRDRIRQEVQILVSREERLLVSITYNREKDRLDYFVPYADENLKIEERIGSTPTLAEAHREINHEGRPRGMVTVRYRPSELENRIQAESRQITMRLLVLAAVLTFFLAAAFLLLWRIFRRHLEQERANEQLDRLAYVGTLASGLAHEIRNPLNALSLNLDMIHEEISDPRPDSTERTGKIVGLLKSEVGRLSTTLTNFLRFALPGPRRLQMTDIAALLHETIALLEPEMRQRRIEHGFVGERSCITLADPAALRQVFWNVLLNSIQAVEGREERRIEVRSHIADGQCHVEFRDTGPGIPPERREQVFEVFYSTRRGGSGFGLAIARQIVERHDGAIRIDSLDGWGCVVHIQIPIRVGAAPAATKPVA
jgi:signal transduction histidine kinase